MRLVMVQFGPEVGEALRAAILAAVETWPGVRSACSLKADSKSAAVRRMGCVHLHLEADAAAILAALRDLPGIASAEMERERIAM